MKASILMFQFGYCPLVCMNHNRILKNRLISLYERAAWLVYNDFEPSFHQLLKKYNFVTIHQRNLQTLAIEIFQVHDNIAREIMKDIFKIKNNHNNF